MPYVRKEQEDQTKRFIKTGEDTNFDVQWRTRLVDTQPVLKNGIPTFYILSKAGRLEMTTMDMNALEKKAKMMCDPTGRGSYKSDKVLIYLKNEPEALVLKGYVQRDDNGGVTDVTMEWVENLGRFAKTMKTDGADKQMQFAVPIQGGKIFKAGSVDEIEDIVRNYARSFSGDTIEAWIILQREVLMASVTKGIKSRYIVTDNKPTAQSTNYTPSSPGDRHPGNGWIKV